MTLVLTATMFVLIMHTAALTMNSLATPSMHSGKRRLAILSSGEPRTLSQIEGELAAWIEGLEETFYISVDIYFAFHSDVDADIEALVRLGRLARWTRGVQFKPDSFWCPHRKKRATVAANMFKGVNDAWNLALAHERQTNVRYDYTIRYRHDLLCNDANTIVQTFGKQMFNQEINPQAEQLFAGAARPEGQYDWEFSYTDTFWITTRALSEQAFTVFDDVVDDQGACDIKRLILKERCRMNSRQQFFECLVDVRLGNKAPNATFLKNKDPSISFECHIIRASENHVLSENTFGNGRGLMVMPLDFDDHM